MLWTSTVSLVVSSIPLNHASKIYSVWLCMWLSTRGIVGGGIVSRVRHLGLACAHVIPHFEYHGGRYTPLRFVIDISLLKTHHGE